MQRSVQLALEGDSGHFGSLLLAGLLQGAAEDMKIRDDMASLVPDKASAVALWLVGLSHPRRDLHLESSDQKEGRLACNGEECLVWGAQLTSEYILNARFLNLVARLGQTAAVNDEHGNHLNKGATQSRVLHQLIEYWC